MHNLKWLAVGLLAIALVAGPSVGEARAADEHAAKADEGHGKPDVAKSFGLKRWDLGIFTLAVFALLLVILGKFAWGPMLAGLDKREANLRRIHDEAEEARKETQKALAEIQARLAKANDEVRAMLDEARRDAQAVKDKMKADTAVEIQAERDRIRREIETAKDAALQEIYQQSVQLASLLSTKAIQRELTPADHSRLLDDALADLRTNLGSKA